jgi:hypothetical protein
MADVIFRTRGPGYPILSFIADKRDEDPPASWKDIADAIAEITDGAVEVGRDTIRRWHEAALEAVA